MQNRENLLLNLKYFFVIIILFWFNFFQSIKGTNAYDEIPQLLFLIEDTFISLASLSKSSLDDLFYYNLNLKIIFIIQF